MTESELEKHQYELITKEGSSKFWRVIKKMARVRLGGVEREKRKHFPKSEYRRLFELQRGKCTYPNCLRERKTNSRLLDIPFTLNELDHIDSHRKDFNDKGNRQLLHKECNRDKAAKDMLTQSKESGETMKSILSKGAIEDEI